MILSLFRKDPIKDAADALYASSAEQARLPGFYLDLGVADTVEGRYELAVLHAYLVLRRLRQARGDTEKLARTYSDVFFSAMDAALRELGVGDLSVAKKIRAMAEAFYGRLAAYEAALAEDAAPEALDLALARNVYASEDAAAASALAGYVRRSVAALESQPDSRVMLGVVAFAAPETP